MRYLALLLIVGCNRSVPVFFQDISNFGQTTCDSDNRPIIIMDESWFKQFEPHVSNDSSMTSIVARRAVLPSGQIKKISTPNSVLYQAVLIHEKVHSEQINSYFHGCNLFLLKYTHDPMFKLRTEVEAYCQSMSFMVAHGRDRLELRKSTAAILRGTYSLPFTYKFVFESLACPSKNN